MLHAITQQISSRRTTITGAGSDLPAADCAGDPWTGLSADVIGRFADFISSAGGMSPQQRIRLVCELIRFDAWMQARRGRTLVCAQPADLLLYVRMYLRVSAPQRSIEPILTGLRMFYSFARNSGCRDDDPSLKLPHPWTVQARAALSGLLGIQLPLRGQD